MNTSGSSTGTYYTWFSLFFKLLIRYFFSYFFNMYMLKEDQI